MFMSDMLLSVSCITYNHLERYIRDAIMKGFLITKTNFRYRILIPWWRFNLDDTANIIREYEKKKFPDLIKLFIKRKSNGLKVSALELNIIWKSKGNTLLWRDDYWTDHL